MTNAMAMTAIWAILAGALTALASDIGRADETAAATAWLAEARRLAKPDGALTAPAPPAADDEPTASEPSLADPFNLDTQPTTRDASSSRRRSATAANDGAPLAKPPVATVQLVGTLVQENAAYAVLKIDGATHRVHVGDILPQHLGRVLQIREDAVEISGIGTARVISMESPSRRDQMAPATTAVAPTGAMHRSARQPGEAT